MIYLVWYCDQLIAVKGNECDAKDVVDRLKSQTSDAIDDDFLVEEVEIGWEEQEETE